MIRKSSALHDAECTRFAVESETEIDIQWMLARVGIEMNLEGHKSKQEEREHDTPIEHLSKVNYHSRHPRTEHTSARGGGWGSGQDKLGKEEKKRKRTKRRKNERKMQK